MKLIDVFKKMTRKRWIFFILFLFFSILWAFAIFGFSASDAKESSAQSSAVTRLLVRLIEPDFDNMSEAEQETLIGQYHRLVRKTAHFCAFALLGFLTYFCVGSIKYLPHGLFVQAAISVPFCALFAVSDEIHQVFVDGRTGSIHDVGVDVCGAAFGTVIAILLSLVYKWRVSKKS